MFNSLAGGSYNNILYQYSDSTSNPNAYAHNNTVLAGTWFDSSAVLNGLTSQIMLNEIDLGAFIVNPSWTNTPDTQILVFPQQGSTYGSEFDGYCGIHFFDQAVLGSYASYNFSVVKYLSDTSGCNYGFAGEVVKQMEVLASHEYAETVTDPQIYISTEGWATNDQCGLFNCFYEIGDLCNQQGVAIATESVGVPVTVYVQQLWDNSDTAMNPAGSCDFAHGNEYYSASTGKHTVQNQIRDEYVAIGQTASILGYPTSEQFPVAGGAESDFQVGSIYWSASTGAHEVNVGIYTLYTGLGGPSGMMGFPTTDELSISSGRVSYFQGTGCTSPNQGSAIYWSSPSGVHEVHGCIFQKYKGMGEANSGLGFPTSNQAPIYASDGITVIGQRNSLQNGTIYWSSATGAWFTYGGINAKYSGMNGPNSVLGFPTSDEQYAQGGAFNTFQNGGIYWSGSTGAHELDGPIASKYSSMGGLNSGLGFPATDVYPVAGGYESDLQNGSLYYYSSATGAHFTYGGINAKYHSMGGPSSWLGFPISDEHGTTVVANGRESDFQYGYIVWDFSTGQATAYQYNLPCPPNQPC